MTIAQLNCVALVVLVPQAAAADKVSSLISLARTAPEVKVRYTAVIELGKIADPRGVRALAALVRARRELAGVRGLAAAALARLRAHEGIPALRAAARAHHRRVRRAARAALGRLCPARLRGIRYYVRVEQAKSEGPMAGTAGQIAVLLARKLLAELPGVTTGWPRCRRPSRRALRRRRIEGRYLSPKVTVRRGGRRVSIELSLMFSSYPRKAIRSLYRASAATEGEIDAELLLAVLPTLVRSLADDVRGSLRSR